MQSKDTVPQKKARSQFWNYWYALDANERRRFNAQVLLKGWMAHAALIESKESGRPVQAVCSEDSPEV